VCFFCETERMNNKKPLSLTAIACMIITIMQGGMTVSRAAAQTAETNSPVAESSESSPEKAKGDNDVIKVIAGEVDEVEKIKGAATSTDIIDVSGISGGMTSASELLSERVGLRTKRFGGLGSYSTLSIRGCDPGQVMFYLDGVLLNDATSGEVNLENLPLENLERIEIYRGFTPARFGTSGIGGAVNLVTRKSRDYGETLASVGYGSFDTSKVVLSRAQKIKKFDYLVYFNRTGSSGDFTFTNNRGTPENSSDDRRQKRKNNDHQSYSATVKGGYENDKVRVSLMDDFFFKEQGLPGSGTNAIKSVRLETIRNTARAGIKTSGIGGAPLSLDLDCFYSMNQHAYDNPDGEYLGLGNALTRKGVHHSAGADLAWELSLPAAYQCLTLLTSYQYEVYRSREKSSSTDYETRWGPRQHRHHAGLVLEDEIIVLEDRLRIIPQIRYEYWSQMFSGDEYGPVSSSSVNREYHHAGGQLGLKYFPRDGLFLKTSAGNGFRAPTFTELFGDRGYITGNSSLRPETSVSVDAGAGYVLEKKISVLDRVTVEYTFFYTLVWDRIIMLNNSQYTMKAQNIDEAEITGHEISLGIGLFEHLDLGCNYTNMRAIDRGQIPYYRGKYLPHRPVHEVSFTARVKSTYIACGYELSYTGANFRDRYNSASLYVRRRLIHSMTVEIFPYRGVTLTFEVKNMDDNDVRDLAGYPLPGISCFGTASVRY